MGFNFKILEDRAKTWYLWGGQEDDVLEIFQCLLLKKNKKAFMKLNSCNNDRKDTKIYNYQQLNNEQYENQESHTMKQRHKQS